jgi:CRISPR system Cascade subunit CasC
MSESRFLQLHFLTSYHASLLNRDDVGLAKRIPFGGASRIRVSSQCLKRHWRTHEGKHALSDIDGKELSVRSRRIFEEAIAQPLAEEHDEELVRNALMKIQDVVLGSSEASDDPSDLETEQVIILGRPEIEYLKELTLRAIEEASSPSEAQDGADDLLDRDEKKNLRAMKEGAGIDAAMFGRMVTSDVLARVDASVHVAHAFTVHEEEAESDYFTAVDELAAEDDELGSGHLNEAELTSGLYYGYLVIDVPLLVSNLSGVDRADWEDGDRELAADVAGRMVNLIATVSPGAKLGSTAPYSYAQFLMAEAGDRQPRSLSSAFLEPVPKERGHLLDQSVNRLSDHLSEMDDMYGSEEERVYSAVGDPADVPAEPVDGVDSLSNWVRNQVQ